MQGFFKPTSLTVVKTPSSMIPKCGQCGLLKTCKTPKMEPTGNGRKGVLICGEAPGADEDSEGRQFVGKTGSLLNRTLASFGVNMRKDCILTNALICRPPNNEVKEEKMIDYCRPNLLKAIREYDPKVVILLGNKAIKSLLSVYHKEDVGGIKRWAGYKIPCQRPNVWVCPTFHPSFVSREERDKGLLERVFTRHLKEAFDLAGDRPWDSVPDYKSQVELIYDPVQAAKLIRKFIVRGGRVAFDYETTTLKPDGPYARIVCCSVCWEGKRTISYPWMSEAITATKELLLSPRLRKIASNLKFEERWSRRLLRTKVIGWRWDTMQQAHVIDCRPGINSIKFQAFVRLGQEDYDGHLSEYLKSKDKGGNAPNRIKEIDMKDLLLYCGMDSLLEYKVAELQAKELGVTL